MLGKCHITLMQNRNNPFSSVCNTLRRKLKSLLIRIKTLFVYTFKNETVHFICVCKATGSQQSCLTWTLIVKTFHKIWDSKWI